MKSKKKIVQTALNKATKELKKLMIELGMKRYHTTNKITEETDFRLLNRSVCRTNRETIRLKYSCFSPKLKFKKLKM